MTARPVQAVFFWRADMTAAFKAAYGRKPRGSTYTKDFHQPRSEQARALERAFGIEEGGDITVTWKWPGGEYKHGRFKPAADYDPLAGGRMNLRWETDNAPLPWRLTPSPTEATASTLQGTPDLPDESKANAQLQKIQDSGETPWFIAVHLHGDGAILHARVVLENPLPGRTFASWETLPKRVRDAMTALASNKTGGVVEFEEGLPVRAEEIVRRILEAFRESPNVLLVGPPGTGKTVAMEDFKSMFEGSGAETPTFDPDILHGAFGESMLGMDGDPRVRSLVFHPSYTYEDFVVGLLPEPVGGDKGGVTVRPHVGPLLELAHFASRSDRRALLLCDEFNRGAAAAIFGDMLALLDRDKRAQPGKPGTGARITTPYHHISPKTSDGELLDAVTSLPSSLFILAAMNSADRSVAPLDAALRRRFSILFIEPDLELLAEHLGASAAFNPISQDSWTDAADIKALGVAVLRGINGRIEAVVGRDFLLGQSVFWNVEGATRDEALRSLAVAFDNQVMGTLTLSFTDNDAGLAAVLNVDPSGDDAAVSTGVAAVWHQPGEAIRQVAAPRLRPVRLQDLDADDLISALASLL